MAPHAPRLVRRRGPPGRCGPRALTHHPAPVPVLRLPAGGPGPALGRRGDRPVGLARPARRVGQGAPRRSRCASATPSSRASGTASRSRSRSSTRACSASRACPAAVDNPAARRLEAWLDRNQWLALGADGVAVGQPRLLCVVDLRGRTDADLLKGMNQQWRRNVKKAEKAGVAGAHRRSRGARHLPRPLRRVGRARQLPAAAQGVLRGHGAARSRPTAAATVRRRRASTRPTSTATCSRRR